MRNKIFTAMALATLAIATSAQGVLGNAQNLLQIPNVSPSPNVTFQARANLESCNMQQTRFGQFVYIGRYGYGGEEFVANFSSYCPYSIIVNP